jgi:hypothetical protein
MRGSKIIFNVAIAISAIWFVNDHFENKKKQNDYLKGLNLILVGKVDSVNIPRPFNGFGIVKVSMIESNFSSYDPRKDHESYYCLINDNQAEIYQYFVDACEPGDIVKVNTSERTFTIQKRDTIIKRDIILYTNQRFYEYVQKNHQKF